jgi:formate dehydrogenase subunit gamma
MIVAGEDPAMSSARKAPEREFVRFTYSHRLMHLFMFVPFIILVLTGFPIKFPDSGFWDIFVSLFGGIENMRLYHRLAAAVMIVDFVVHVIYIFYKIIRNKTPLTKLPLLPGPKDARDLWLNLRHFLFLTDERPQFHKFSYIEKFDYWAVFWGMFIMAGSGLILWFPEEAGSFMASELIQIAYVAHSDEALLAFLAIAIWHFYNVHFNPRIWPANKVWYKGTLTESEMRHEHPLELEEILEKERKSEMNEVTGEEGAK